MAKKIWLKKALTEKIPTNKNCQKKFTKKILTKEKISQKNSFKELANKRIIFTKFFFKKNTEEKKISTKNSNWKNVLPKIFSCQKNIGRKKNFAKKCLENVGGNITGT